MKVHFEPYLHLAAVTHKSALIAWGGFYFKVAEERGAFKLIGDSDLDSVHPPRQDSIGARSSPYGPARVEVFDESGPRLVSCAETTTTNHAWVPNLEADTVYRYRVLVNGREWAEGPRRDWRPGSEQGLVEGRSYASLTPGLFYRFRYGRGIELICIDTSRRSLLFGERFFRHVNHRPFLEAAFPADAGQGKDAPRWRIPFSHHPPYCAGPMPWQLQVQPGDPGAALPEGRDPPGLERPRAHLADRSESIRERSSRQLSALPRGRDRVLRDGRRREGPRGDPREARAGPHGRLGRGLSFPVGEGRGRRGGHPHRRGRAAAGPAGSQGCTRARHDRHSLTAEVTS